MIESIKLILGVSGSDYDIFIGIMSLWLLGFTFSALFNIFHSLFKGSAF